MLKIEISTDLIYDRADQFKGSALFCVISRSREIDSLLSEKLARLIDFLLVVRIVYGD